MSVQSSGSESSTSWKSSARPTPAAYLRGLWRATYPHRAGEAVPEHVLDPRDLDEQRALERLAGAHDQLRAGVDPALVQIAQHRGVAVRDALEASTVAGLEVGQAHGSVVGDVELGAGDRVAVRIVGRVAELFGDQLLEVLGDVVLE